MASSKSKLTHQFFENFQPSALFIPRFVFLAFPPLFSPPLALNFLLLFTLTNGSVLLLEEELIRGDGRGVSGGKGRDSSFRRREVNVIEQVEG